MATKAELEAKIASLELKNKILLDLAQMVTSIEADCSLSTRSGDFEIVHKLYGGYSVNGPGHEGWEDIKTFDEAVERIYKHKSK